ncbi:ABC transporter permease [Jiella sonneratiae]|uniref:ABC transporter permease n=1 Tax=Jiella sonneratiae TaxID=2816856 RepID=A0ABS3JC47_9HYPH|nr:ABC transporter permease [Jiella sonneratiae]MBO0906146.1 ABC transporter permease [Jiella sonneratiae]
MSTTIGRPAALDATAASAAGGLGFGQSFGELLIKAYLGLFFFVLFAPIVFMVAAAFNAYPSPTITIWQGFTLKWFAAIVDDARIMNGLLNSLMIAAGVIAIAIPLGLSGALLLTRLESRANGILYTVLVAPIMIPGIVLGCTTMIFWRDAFGVDAGLFTAMMAQTAFIASYCLLMFMARLSRQDRSLEEAAADLGATPFFTFRRVTLPFLSPTIGMASVIAFLQSIENFPTTFFAIGPDYTLVTEIASRMRFGLSPMINAIGVIFIAVTVAASLVWAIGRMRAERRAQAGS